MNQLVFIEKGQVVTDSLTVAEVFGKEHKNVLADIKRILEKESEHKNDFELSSYKNNRNKEYKKFLITEKGKQRLEHQYKYNSKAASLEKAFGEWLTILFPNERIIPQYNVLNYRIDFYMADLGISIEYDEKEHQYKSERDLLRQREIQEELKRYHLEHIEYDRVLIKKDASKAFPFIRVKEGYEIEGIRELLILMRNHTMNDIVIYME